MDPSEQIKKLSELINGKLGTMEALTKQHAEELAKLAKGATSVEALVAEHGKSLEALKGLRDEVEKYLKQFPKMNADQRRAKDGEYSGFWPNAKMAEDFGHLVLATVLGREASAKHIIDNGYAIRSASGQFAKGEDWVKAMGISGDTSGGYLVPDEFVATIIRHVDTYGVLRRKIRKVPMSRERQSWPKRTGGFTVYYPDEGVAPTASDISLGKVTLNAKKWAVLTFFSRELDEDSAVGLGELIAFEVALALAKAEDTNGFMGDGTAAYAGIVGVMKSPNVALVTMGTGKTAFTDITHDDLVSLKYAVPDWVRQMPDAGYYMSSDLAGVCERMKDGMGRPLYQPPTENTPLRIAGYPVEPTKPLPETGDSAISTPFIAFGSLMAWGMLGQRRSMMLERSTEVKWLEDQVAIKAVSRQDIQETDGDAMALLRTAAA